MKAEVAEAAQTIASETPNIQLVYLFGSHAKQTSHDASDVDIAVLFEDTPGLRELLRIEGMFERALSREVDLVGLTEASARLHHQVLEHGECLYAEDETRRVGWETEARQRYLDMKPHLDQRVNEAKHRIFT